MMNSLTRQKIYYLFFLYLLLLLVPGRIYAITAWPISATSLRCEYRENPEGLDVLTPRLSWINLSGNRGDAQSSYQILVASTSALLEKNVGDIWNSGKVRSNQNTQIQFKGKALRSGQKYYWKVKVWGKHNQGSDWSIPAHWSMGLLNKTDWRAEWIADPLLADTLSIPLTPINCYRSVTTLNQMEPKMITLDLGTVQMLNAADLIPARPDDLHRDIRTLMFPLRFKIEAASKKDFSDALTLVDHSSSDYNNPRKEPCHFTFKTVKARYIRLNVNKLSSWNGALHALALAGFKIWNNETLLSSNAMITCTDAVESEYWSKNFLNSTQKVTLLPLPEALEVNLAELKKIPASRKTSRVTSLRKEFTLTQKIRQAKLFVTSRGFYEIQINGNRVGDQMLAPGTTDYHKRISYQTYDVTDMLNNGANAIGALLGYGWYAGHMNLGGNKSFYGGFPLLMAQLEVELVNGKRITIVTDKSWKSTLSGAILWSDLLDGEAYDYRQENTGWNKPGYNDKAWNRVYTQRPDTSKLVWQRSQPVREVREFKPISINNVKPGVYVFDLGQEIAGWCKIKLKGKAGTHITLRHAEAVKPDGNIDVGSLWGTSQQDDYILDGKGPVVCRPHFTYHGFRYVEVSGLTDIPDQNTLTGVSMHSDVPTAGRFESSNPLFNQLMKASQRTQWNLMFDIPNGVAARSERVAWTGDIRPCVQTAIFNMDVAAFFEKYVQDIRDAQTAEGRYTDIAPHAHLSNTRKCVGSPGWADAGTSLPWQLYENYGDTRILKEHYTSAKQWLEYVWKHNPDLIWENERGNDWGDWISAGTPTPKVIGSTAFFAHNADLVARMAGVLGQNKDERKYRQLFNDIKTAFVKRFVNNEGHIIDLKGPDHADAQGSYALALHFKLLNEPLRSKAAAHLVTLIEKNNGHLATGFWSSIELLLALSENENKGVAASIANLRTKPSWGYMVASGGTTFWEGFDSDKRNQSLNHWTHSAIGEWLWRYVAGLSPDEKFPGYQRFSVDPYVSAEADSCDAEYNSIRGKIGIKWKSEKELFTMEVRIPVGSTAMVSIPVTAGSAVTESGVLANKAEGVKFIKNENNKALFEVRSGTYLFESKKQVVN